MGAAVGWTRAEIEGLRSDDVWPAYRVLAATPVPLEIEEGEPLSWQIPAQDYLPWEPSAEEVVSRHLGAWQGRIAGCILGKPVELGPVFGDPRTLRRYLKSTGQWPVRSYLARDEAQAKEAFGCDLGCPASWRENLAFAESDDDLRYTYAGLAVLDRYGPSFGTAEVARWWVENLTPSQLYTAEQAVIANLYRLGIPHGGALDRLGEQEWTWIREYANPYREWIGAAIRADGWAYAYAGDPVGAARAAQRDARLSHDRNGEYSEIFFAALIAGAFRWSLPEAIERAFQTIPPGSRLSLGLRKVQQWLATERNDEEWLEWLWAEFGHYHGVHAINNAAVCLGALLLRGDDFGAAVGAAVMGGWDTDCNGATVGSVWGALHGAAQLPRPWTEPLHDRLELGLPSAGSLSITELARWTTEIWARLRLRVGPATASGGPGYGFGWVRLAANIAAFGTEEGHAVFG